MVMAPKRTTNVAVANAATWIGWNPVTTMPTIRSRPRKATGAFRVRRGSWAAEVKTTKSGLAPRSRILLHDPWTRKASPSRKVCWARFPWRGRPRLQMERTWRPWFSRNSISARVLPATRERGASVTSTTPTSSDSIPAPVMSCFSWTSPKGEQAADPLGLAGDEQLVPGPDPLPGLDGQQHLSRRG